MKFHRLLILFFLLSIRLSLAANVNVSGKVTDDKKEAVVGATVLLLNAADSSLSKVNVTDVNGTFVLEGIKPGNYVLKITSIGFATYFSNKITVDASDVQIPAIALSNSSVNLKETNITAMKPLIEVRSDKTVFNVENSINATGSTAYELLQKAPGVMVDQNNNSIFLKGRGGVMVQIDGKPSQLTGEELADMLKSMQSTEVEAIELVSNPSSKYEAEGTAGIINIKLKKNKNFGTNGSVTTGYVVGVYSRFNGSLALNHRHKKINAFGTYSNNFGKRQNTIDIYRVQAGNIYDQKTVSVRDPFNNNFKAGIDYSINKKNTIGVMANGYIADFTATSKSETYIKNLTGESIEKLIANSDNKGHNQNLNFNGNYRYVDSLGHELNLDLDYGQYRNDRNSYQPNIYTYPGGTFKRDTIYRIITPTDIDIYSLKVDYSQNFLKGKIGAGLKVSHVKTDNDYGFYNVVDGSDVRNNSVSNHFVYTENVNAVYLNYQRTINKFDVQAGVRTEQTSSKGDLTSTVVISDSIVNRNYWDIFPSAGITYNLNKKNALGLSYSSRIERPNYQELNPFEYKMDELTYRKGNPFLNPQYANKFEFSHTYNYSITTSLSYSNTRAFFAQISDTIEGNKSFLTTRNLASEEVIGLNFSASHQVMKWWSVYGNAGVSNLHYKADFGNGKIIDNEIVNFNSYVQNTFKVKKGVSLEFSGWYSSPGVWGGAHKTEEQWSLDAGLQMKFLKDLATLKLSVSDIFYTMPWRSNSQFGGLSGRANGSWESRTFRASLSYRFGNTNVKSIKQRTGGVESETKRVGGNE